MVSKAQRTKILFITLCSISIVMSIYAYTKAKATPEALDESLKILEKFRRAIQTIPGVAAHPEVIPDRRNNLTDCTARKPLTDIASWQWATFPERKWQQYQLPVVVIVALGRLGNLMGNYATIYAIGRAYGASVGITPELYNGLSPLFPNLSLPVIRVPKHNMVVPDSINFLYAGMEAAAAGLFGPQIFIAQGTPIECQLFHAYTCDIRREFSFHQDLQEKVKAFWSENEGFVNGSIRVGFHIRRTDYLEFVERYHGTPLPNETYYFRAMDFYKNKFPKVIFVVATDDHDFTKNVFQGRNDVIHTQGTSPPEDMAILASCDHSIITVGTFGFWTAYLAGGYVVYPKEFNIKDYPIQKERYQMAQMDFFIPIA